MAIDKAALREWRRLLREILNRDWDPIDGCPPDEYDQYADRITAMVRDRAADGEILSYLEWAELENMGLPPPFDRDRGTRVIAAVRQLGPLPSV